MISHPKIGTVVMVWYAAKARHARPLHGKTGTVIIASKGRPRNHGILIGGAMSVTQMIIKREFYPAWNLRNTWSDVRGSGRQPATRSGSTATASTKKPAWDMNPAGFFNASPLLEQWDSPSFQTLTSEIQTLTSEIIMTEKPKVVNLNPASPSSAKRRFNFQPIEKLVKQHPGSRTWWIRGYIPASSVVLIYGDPACGKTTIAANMAISIASKKEWCGIPTQQSRVLYVAAEDFYGARLRIEAAFDYYGIPPSGIDVLDEPVVIADEEDVEGLIEYIKGLPEKPAILVVDTLALSMGKYSENNDMQLFCNGATRIKRETGVTAIVIHHCGHGDKGRTRGGSQLPANADAIFAVERKEDICVMKCQKMKNGREPKALAWRMESQNTQWLDEEGKVITSVILESADIPSRSEKQPLGNNQRKALEILNRLFQEQQNNLIAGGIKGKPRITVQDWTRAMQDAGIQKQRCSEVKSALKDRKLIEVDDGGYVVPSQAVTNGNER